MDLKTHFTSQHDHDPGPNEPESQNILLSTILLKSSKYFSSFVQTSEETMYNHLNNMALYFKLDAEVYLFSLIIFHRYMKVVSLIIFLKKSIIF
jgi:hypothetical protein